MAIRVAAFEIKFADMPRERARATMNEWRSLCRDIQRATNLIWQQWLVWHVQQDSISKIREDIDAYNAWSTAEKKTRGPKPKWRSEALPKALRKQLYRLLCDEFPHMHGRPLNLLLQEVSKKITQRKAARGSMRGWAAILLAWESIPSATKEQPIPFDKKSAPGEQPFVPPIDRRKENWRMRVRLDRIVKPGRKNSDSTITEVELVTKTRRAQSQAAHLEKILSGQYKFCGSSIVCRGTKWFALICFDQQREKPVIESEKTIVVRPARTHPWSIRVNGRTRWLQGRGEAVGAKRRQLNYERRSRQNSYRNAGSNAKGHGRNRGMGPVFRLRRRWRDFVHTMNHTLTKELLRVCQAEGAGRVVLIQPADEWRETRFLTTAGKTSMRESTGWDWFQVSSMLYKLRDEGIDVRIEKHGDRPLRDLPETDSSEAA